MSELKGITKQAFAVGLIAAIIVSTLLSTGIGILITPSTLKGEKGDTGPQGEQGIQGIQGEKGDKGDPGGVTADVTASLKSTFTDVWLGTDYHDVEGLIINFGTEAAVTVYIKITWHLTAGGEHTEPKTYIGTLAGHEIYEFSKRYIFEGGYDYITWEITWS